MTDPVVLIEGLGKRYGRHQALHGLDLTVEPGEVFGFLGPNGAGKTTTIRLLLDLIRPSAGSVRVFGMDPRAHAVEIRRRAGYLPGELTLEGRQTAGELLAFLGHLRGGIDARRIHALAERLDLDLSRPIRGLSKGNKQKVGLVQAFMHHPDLLILDEPTSGLDPLLQQEFLDWVRQARADGQTVFMSSHVLAEVQHVADRVGIVRAGRMVAVDDVDSMRARAVRRIEIHFDAPVPKSAFAFLAGVRDVTVDGATLRCLIEGHADALVKAAAQFTVVDLKAEEPDLEELFLSYYTEGDEHRAA